MIRKGFLFSLVFCCFLSGGAFAADLSSGSFDMNGTIGKLGDVVAGNLSAGGCLGTPVTVGDMTLIPVVSKCFGFGLGGGNFEQNEAGNREKDAHEGSKERQGMGSGAGGAVRIVAIIIIKKDGAIQVHRLQENFLAQALKELVPVFQQAINKHFQLKMQRFEKEGNPPPPPPQGK